MIAYFDMFSGISGDMTLGALVDLGVPVEYLADKLSSVLSGFNLKAEPVLKSHLSATDITVEVTEDSQTSRHYTDIKAMIETSKLPDTVKTNSLSAFEKIAVAEAGIHQKEIETVHFHEIGGVDSIVDIIGSFLAVEYLGVTKIYGSVVPLGSGFVECAHGTIPVPVPATLAILKDIPVTSSDATTEIVTPTGAALISTLADSFGPMPQMKIEKTGYGAGKRQTGSSRPNLMRVVIGHADNEEADNEELDNNNIYKEQIFEIKTNIDDFSPEGLGFLMEDLFDLNALDVTYVPIQMKKNRPGTQIEVLCRKENLDVLIQKILSATTSIGVRYYPCERAYLKRKEANIKTRFGTVQAKKIIRPDGTVEYAPEYEAVKTIAKANRLEFKDVYNQVLTDANSFLKST